MVLITEKQYYMSLLLKSNLEEVPKFLKRSWDCVIIVSGHGKVRIGKSTLALQIGYYLAWLLSKAKKQDLKFSLRNIVFSPEELMDIADKLPSNSVIIYDEGRAGLDSARAMENINKTMMDFFQECGQYGHIIIIVLPNFFRLREDIAISRSLFLVDCYTGRNYQRGYFKFYNEVQKEFLYTFGKKKYGIFNKYSAARDSFSGRFSRWLPIDKEKYEEKKKQALRKKVKKRKLDERLEMQRAFAVNYMLKSGLNERQVGSLLKMTQQSVNLVVNRLKDMADLPDCNIKPGKKLTISQI